MMLRVRRVGDKKKEEEGQMEWHGQSEGGIRMKERRDGRMKRESNHICVIVIITSHSIDIIVRSCPLI